MTPFECYTTYLALKQHFTSDYDYHKYHGKVSASVDSFNTRRDRFFFEKLAKHNDPTGFLLANIISDSGVYIRDLVYNQEAKDRYLRWLKRKESMTYLFSNEIGQLKDDFNNNFLCNSGHPFVIRLFLAEKISLETLCILCDLSGCMKYWRKQLKGDVIYEDIELLVKKYTPFLSYDNKRFKEVVRKRFA